MLHVWYVAELVQFRQQLRHITIISVALRETASKREERHKELELTLDRHQSSLYSQTRLSHGWEGSVAEFRTVRFIINSEITINNNWDSVSSLGDSTKVVLIFIVWVFVKVLRSIIGSIKVRDWVASFLCREFCETGGEEEETVDRFFSAAQPIWEIFRVSFSCRVLCPAEQLQLIDTISKSTTSSSSSSSVS